MQICTYHTHTHKDRGTNAKVDVCESTHAYRKWEMEWQLDGKDIKFGLER